MYQLFKGYVLTKNKKCMQSFKDVSSADLLKLNDVKNMSEYAGILNDDTVLIDIDDEELSNMYMQIVEDRQLKCRVYATSRGKHFLFKNSGLIERNKTGCKLACGIKSDIKLGLRTSYSVLKYDGKPRKIIYDLLDNEDYETVYKWSLPVRSKSNFTELGAGDGRNQELFNYILTLQAESFSKSEITDCIEIINKYVLKEKLSDSEVKTILRDESFQKPAFFEKNKFQFDKFAKFLVAEHNIVKINGVLHYYAGDVYNPANLETMMIKHIPNLNDTQRKEVLKYLNVLITENTQVSPANLIAFKNGVYDVKRGVLEPFSADMILTNKIPHDYVSNAHSEIADRVLNDLSCNDKQVRTLLEEVIGYTFYRRSELRKAFLLKGKRHNGKSTFISMLATLHGEDNYSSLDLADLSHEYKASGLIGKLVNLGDDVEDDYIANSGIFKKIVSGDRINCNVKYGQPIEFNPYCKLIFSGNNIPRIGRGSDSSAIVDRLVIVPLNGKFNPKNKGFDPFIKYKLRTDEVMQYLILIGLAGLKRVLETNSFTTTEQIEQELVEYEETLNPVITFFSEVGDSLLNEPTKKCYKRYNEFCYESSLKPISHIQFSKQVKEYFGYDIKNMRIEGKTHKVFVKKG